MEAAAEVAAVITVGKGAADASISAMQPEVGEAEVFMLMAAQPFLREVEAAALWKAMAGTEERALEE
jgi:hypothetical protein